MWWGHLEYFKLLKSRGVASTTRSRTSSNSADTKEGPEVVRIIVNNCIKPEKALSRHLSLTIADYIVKFSLTAIILFFSFC